jgi:hypothetical protein
LSAQVSPLLVWRSHYAVRPSLGCVVFPARTTLATVKLHSEIHSSSLASLESVTQSHLADRPQPINSSHGLSVPTALEGSKVRFPRAFACPPRSAFRVWLPSWRFTPFVTRAGFISHRQRSWDLPFGAFSTRKVPDRFPDRMDPHTDYPAVDSECRSTQAGSASRGFWALTLARVPGDPHVFSMPTAGCSRGFSPLRATRKSLGRDFAQPPLTRFATKLASRRRRLRVSISFCSFSSFPFDLR